MDKILTDILINDFDTFPNRSSLSGDLYVKLNKIFFSPKMYIFEYDLNNEVNLIIRDKWS